LSEVKKKGRKRSSNPNRSAPMLQATVLIYLNYHSFALQEHLLNVCKTNAFYLNNYILPHLLKQEQIQLDVARKKKSYRLTDAGRADAEEWVKHIKNKTSIGKSSFLVDIDLEELRKP